MKRNNITRFVCALLCVLTLSAAMLSTLVGAVDLPVIPLDQFGKPIKAGDVNCDGKINSRDVILVMRQTIGAVPEGAVFEKRAADVNKDDKINSRDVIAIMKMALGA